MRRPEKSVTPADPVVVERVGGRSWRPIVVVLLIMATIGVALAKPWDSLRTAPQNIAIVPPAVLTPPPTDTAQPSPTSDPALDKASLLMVCNAPSGWRLLS